MESDTGIGLVAAAQQISELEQLVDSLSKKIKDLEAENSGLRDSVSMLKKDRNYRRFAKAETLQPSPKETTKSSYYSVNKPDIEVISLENTVNACAPNVRPDEEETQDKELDHLMNNALDIFSVSEMKQRKGDLSHYCQKHVALKLTYQGERFHGFASEASNQRTVESELFIALEKTKLMTGGRVEAKYTRCGRTDKGVSANGQVIALLLRSYRKGPDCDAPVSMTEEDRVIAAIASRSQEYEFAKLQDGDEIDYVGVLNRALPMDIRVVGWCYVPWNFHARFSCLSREYNFIFINDGLDIEAMRVAAGKFKGEHDFRNFCKMDADNVHNYRREILQFEIIPVDGWNGTNLWMFRVKGTAFLWHQVRCMVAVLFMVGERKESPSIVDELLDVEKVKRKPQYLMASETCLVLQSCEFKGVSFYCPPGSVRSLHLHYKNMVRERVLAAAMLNHAYGQFHIYDASENFEETAWKETPHVPLADRPTEPTYEERRIKLLQKNQAKP